MTEPTDAEIETLWQDSYPNRFEAISFARAVLAKWGAPQQEAQEPCPSCRNSDIYACTCPFPTPRNATPRPTPAPLSEQDPLQGAANWLVTAHAELTASTLASKLSIGYNRAKRLRDAALAASQQ